jgi:hypothetical protein
VVVVVVGTCAEDMWVVVALLWKWLGILPFADAPPPNAYFCSAFAFLPGTTGLTLVLELACPESWRDDADDFVGSCSSFSFLSVPSVSIIILLELCFPNVFGVGGVGLREAVPHFLTLELALEVEVRT